MSSDLEVMHKILKNEENRKILCILNEKEALTYDELMDAFHLGTYLLNYHLKVLVDFLTKTADDKYVLSEKGKQAYALLNNLPKSTGVSRRWKITWLISIVSNIVIASLLSYVFNRPRSIVTMALLISFGLILSYALQIKPKITGRLLYITLGAVFIGCFFMLFTMKIFFSDKAYAAMFPSGSTGDHIILILSVVVCYVIGGLVGELIGKKMQYKWPPSRTF
jgi:hypothetical protein